MSRWKELPASLDQKVWQLVVQMRRLKDHGGLSLSALAAKTTFSKSSWERYLNGRTLPPRSAVEELARVCDADPERLLALHEVAESAWAASAPSRNGEGETPGERATEPLSAVASPRRRGFWMTVGGLGIALAGGLIGALLVSAPWAGGGTAEGKPEQGPLTGAHEGAFEYGETYRCEFKRYDGRLYAGHSADRKTVIGLNVQGWQVVEAQCLLQHAKFSPGRIDGRFGPNTEIAVKRFQHSRKGLDVDGLVGPQTWGALSK
ncbi:peptidoglycan-binding protein [Streptomyces sp. NBC_01622]|uniref:peptidoglycan-binding protein n=1 Tax=Streptomyces sp. NBC_01622 TaxID=2975903 RepID=UPI003867A555|nr:peptidoglycan-binding protein [Streptomyces sp. NBC_01622]